MNLEDKNQSQIKRETLCRGDKNIEVMNDVMRRAPSPHLHNTT